MAWSSAEVLAAARQRLLLRANKTFPAWHGMSCLYLVSWID